MWKGRQKACKIGSFSDGADKGSFRVHVCRSFHSLTHTRSLSHLHTLEEERQNCVGVRQREK